MKLKLNVKDQKCLKNTLCIGVAIPAKISCPSSPPQLPSIQWHRVLSAMAKGDQN